MMNWHVLCGLVALVAISGCRTAAPAVACPSSLSSKISPEEDRVREMFSGAKWPVTFCSSDFLWKGIIEQGRIDKPWNDFLVRLRSSPEIEARVLAILERRYLEAYEEGEKALASCKPKPGDYDRSWADALKKEVGDRLRQHVSEVRGAFLLTRFRLQRKCQGLTRDNLLVAELEYHEAIHEMMKRWMEFVDLEPGFTPSEKAAFSNRVGLVSGLLRKAAVSRVVLDGYELARLEAETIKLPPDIAAALDRYLSRFKTIKAEAFDDLNRVLQ